MFTVAELFKIFGVSTNRALAQKLGIKATNISNWKIKGIPANSERKILKLLDSLGIVPPSNNTIAGNDAIVGRDDHRPTVVNGNGHHVDIHHGTVRENIENVYSAPDQRGYIKAVVEELWELPKAEQREILRMILNRGTMEK